MDYELLLFDRIEVIRSVNAQYNLENNAYLSFSGGKDSTVLHYLLDLAIPGNSIPRVYINTGIEYNDVVDYVKTLAKQDSRIEVVDSKKNIKKILDEYGYPFKSKEHSLRVEQFNKGSNANFIKKYLRKTDYKGGYVCPKKLLYQFQEKGKYHYSNHCCDKLKKKVAVEWQRKNNRTIVLTGMRSDEGGNRKKIKDCILTDKKGNLKKFHPLLVVDENFLNEFIKRNKIRLCKLYYPPFYFKRTGCKGCPYAIDLEEELQKMEIYLPTERKQCEWIWKPVYEEYRRLGYRLKKEEKISLF